MSHNVTLSSAAKRDLTDAHRWLGQIGAGPRAAKRRQHISQALRELRRHPCRWPEGEHSGFRERPVEGYVIVYEVTPDTGIDATSGDVSVLRIFAPGQDRGEL